MRRGKVWNVRVVSALVAAACLLSACTGSTEGVPVSVSPSSSPAPSTPPKKPAGADEESTAGSKKAIQYFFGLRAYGLASGDSMPMERGSLADCAFCTSSAARISENEESGTSVVGGAVRVTDVEYAGATKGGGQAYRYAATQARLKVVESGGSVSDESTQPTDFSGFIELVWRARAAVDA